MLLREPRVTESNDEICVSARVEFQNTQIETPDTLWFRFPRSYREYLTTGSEGFVAALLPSAMAAGEPMAIEGTVSPRFAYGAREYQRVLHGWHPHYFGIVELDHGSLEERVAKGGNAVAGSFSGGVDSFYTLWQHLPQNESIPGYRITHGLMINGFVQDVDLEDTGVFRALHGFYAPVLERLGVELLTCRSNFREFRAPVMHRRMLSCSFGAPLTSVALMLGGLLSRFYIAGSVPYEPEPSDPDHSHPALDHLLGTESLQIIHDGGEASRVQKAAALAQCPETYENLRVCWGTANLNRDAGRIENCCRCGKCVRTMLTLELLDVADRYSVFPLPLTHKAILTASQSLFGEHLFLAQNLELAKKAGRQDRVWDLRLAMLRDRIVAAIRR